MPQQNWLVSSAEFDWHVGRAMESFQFLASVWDVRKAKEMIKRKPREVEMVPIKAFHGMMGLVYVDKDTFDRVNTAIPIIIAKGRNKGGDKTPWIMVIDGWHRIHKGAQMGLTELPCVYLTEAESRKVKIQ